MIYHTYVTTPSANHNLHWYFSCSPSPSNSDVPIRRWGVSCSRLDNVPGVLCHQYQTHTFPSGVGVSHVHGPKMRRAPFSVGHLAFTDWQCSGSPFPWVVLHSRIDNAPGVRLHLCLYNKILLFTNFISSMFFNMSCCFVCTMVYIVYFIWFFVHETIPICINA